MIIWECCRFRVWILQILELHINITFKYHCFPKIKTTVTNTASEYYDKVQNSSVVKMMVATTDGMFNITEVVAEAVLPTDGNCEEDMKELETADEDATKGAIVRARNLKKMVMRRGRRKLKHYKNRGKTTLMSYGPIKFSVNTVCAGF